MFPTLKLHPSLTLRNQIQNIIKEKRNFRHYQKPMNLPTTTCTCTKPHIPNLQTNDTKLLEIPKTLNKFSTLRSNSKNFPHFWLDLPSHNNSAPINKRWMDYQGSNDWEGLLDPLDDNLRSEIIRYGHFVEAAYRSCDFDTSSSSYATSCFSKRKLLERSGFPDTGYRVTKNLVATSGIDLPGWAKRAPAWMSRKSAWIGYVAVCQDSKEISRLGRRDVVIALRGTATGLEWVENLWATLSPLDFGPQPRSCECPDSEPMVESGFLSLYTGGLENQPSLQTLVRQEISRVLESYGDERLSFTITGHSLGAALATLAAYDIKETFKKSPMVTVISFAGPRVGNGSFRRQVDGQGTKVLRIVNKDDVITKVPGFVVEKEGGGGWWRDPGIGRWVEKLVTETQWVYADVGCELRLSSRDSPYLGGLNFATCHELKTYLHLVDGFVGSNCPFRATARKMMRRSKG